MIARRRFLHVAASAVPVALINGGASAAVTQPMQKYEWQGMALGAPASLQFYHYDKVGAGRIARACYREIARLETLFSLFDPQSTLSQLNSAGIVRDAPADFVALMRQALSISTLTDGAFDMTVGPLWPVYENHFTSGDVTTAPDQAKLLQAAALVDYRNVVMDGSTISLKNPGMAVTLNGIAQGFITDKIAQFLRQQGLHNVLVDMGELRANGGHANGRPWEVGIAHPSMPGQMLDRVALKGQALATSGGYGTQFDRAGRYHHLFDPMTGDSAHHYQSISVIAPSAALADGLSTGFAAMPRARIAAVIARVPGVEARLVDQNGALHRI